MGFDQLGLKAQFLRAVEDLGFTKPTEIQSKAIKPILAGQELIATAPTGSGKTAAFMLPIMQMLKGTNPEYPRVLVLAPTKELATQIAQMTEALNAYAGLKILPLIGGVNKVEQRKKLESGADIIVATPGRFMDLYFEGRIPLKKVAYLVLDEADRLLDMGFLRQLNAVLELLPRKAKKILFSATFPDALEEVVANFIAFPHRIEVNEQEHTAEGITQYKVALPNRLTKLSFLLELLQKPEAERVIIFTRTKQIATETFKYLERKLGNRVGLLHANKGQNTRNNTYEAFKDGSLNILVTTDVSARGIDIPSVSHVINFDVPLVKQDYVHRVGRTARAGRQGVAISFYTEAEAFVIDMLEAHIQQEMEVMEANVEVEEFLPGEQKHHVKDMDLFRQRVDPEYKGAFTMPTKKIYAAKSFKKKK